MLDLETTTHLTERLLRFVNSPFRNAREIEQEFSWPHRNEEPSALFTKADAERDWLPLRKRPLWHYEQLRNQVRDLLLHADRRKAVADFLAERMTAADWRYTWTTIHGVVKLDGHGRLVIEHPRFQSVDDIIAITLAELESPDARVRIVKCKHSACDRFFLRTFGARGAPRHTCPSPSPCAERADAEKEKLRKQSRRRQRR